MRRILLYILALMLLPFYPLLKKTMAMNSIVQKIVLNENYVVVLEDVSGQKTILTNKGGKKKWRRWFAKD